MDNHDFAVLRNGQEFPRAWVVHNARAIEPGRRADGRASSPGQERDPYARDPFWNDPTLTFFDPHGWLGEPRRSGPDLCRSFRASRPRKSESVKVSYPNPQRAILEVMLESPGLVILSDVDYPGWQLTIDGEPAPIYRVNILMRRALVSAGPHRLVYSFSPRSFQIGLVVSIARPWGVALTWDLLRLSTHSSTAKRGFAILGGRGSVRAAVEAGSPGGSPSRNRARPFSRRWAAYAVGGRSRSLTL